MKISEVRPCDNCNGPLATGSYAIDVSMLIVNPRAAREVMGLSMILGDAMGLAEMFAPNPEVVVVAGDKEPTLRTRLLICQECIMNKPLDIVLLLEKRNSRENKNESL